MREAEPAALAAGDVRAALFAALAPVRAVCEAFLAYEPARRAALRYVVQLHPMVIQVVLTQAEGRSRCMAAFGAYNLPDGGARLVAAAEAVAAGLIAGLPEKLAAKALATAAMRQGEGGLYLYVDPTDETAILGLNIAGSLGEGIVLGALMDAPEMVH